MKLLRNGIFICLIFIVSVSIVTAISIGVSPSKLRFENLLQGGYAEKIVTISTSSEDDLTGHFEVQGDISEWLRSEPNNSIFVLSKTNPYKLKIIVEPPSDVRNGSHSGMVSFVTDRLGDLTSRAGGTVKAAVGLSVDVGIINEKISACQAGGFSFKDIEVNYPLELEAIILNNGNVRINPLISVDIWDLDQETLVLSKEISADEILPTVTKPMKISIINNLDIAQYWAKVNIDKCGESDLLTFNVFEKGSIVDKGVLTKLTNTLWALVKEPVQVHVEFQNIGERGVFARFKGSIKLDEKIVKVIETEELEISSGETGNFDFFFSPDMPGRYIISGKVIYNKKYTFEKSSILNVNPQPIIKKEVNRDRTLLLVIYVIIILTIVFIIRKISSQRHK